MIFTPTDTSSFLAIAELVFSHLADEDRQGRLQSLATLYEQNQIDRRGIFGLRQGKHLVGGLFSQVRPDETLLLWPAVAVPQTHEPSWGSRLRLRRLYAAFCRWCDRIAPVNRKMITIMMSDMEQEIDQPLVAEYQFSYLSQLVYLLCTEPHFLPPLPETRKRLHLSALVSENDAHEERLTDLVEKTYRNTLDFPQLSGITPTEAILEGYKVDNVYRPDLWFYVYEKSGTTAGEPIGVLLLTSTPERSEMELTYMGLVESARQKGYAKELLAFAQQKTREEGAAFLLTSVDQQNIAAYRAYLNAGFTMYDQKTLYMR